MSNFVYTKAKEALLAGDIDLVDNTIKVALVDTAQYTPNAATHANLSDVPAGARVAISDALSGKSVTGGVFVANPVTYVDLSGPMSEAIIIYKEGANAASSPLLIFIDQAEYLPIQPNGGDITIDWNDGSGEILSI